MYKTETQRDINHTMLYQCWQCTYMSYSFDVMFAHIQASHNLPRTKFQCSQCEFSTNSRRTLVEHGYIHNYPLICPDCHFATTDTTAFANHTHLPPTLFQCTECEFATLYHSTLEWHKSTCTARKVSTAHEPKFECKMCEYTTHRKLHFGDHLRTHTGERPFKCDKCPYSATRKNTLTKHMRSHTGEKPFKCNECDYTSAWKRSVTIHKELHYLDLLQCNW
jgi:KRAB domain-containing zinc finger protein